MKRYKISAYMIGDMPEFEAIESDDGEWVKYKDVEKLIAENRELMARNKRLIQIINEKGIKEE